MKYLQNKLLQLFFMCVIVLTIWGIINPVMNVQAENDSPACGELNNWVALSQTGGQLSAGNYYLPNDVTLQNNITISSGTINLNLNSSILTGAFGSNQSIFTVTNGTLNIYDCSAVKKVHNYKIKTVQGDLTQDTYANQPAYSNKLFQRFYDFNEVGDGIIEGGIITGGHKFSASPDLKSNFNYAGGGSAILIGNSGGVVNFYGGTLSGNTTTALSQWGGKRERSGTVGVMDGGTFNFYQGQIVGNSSRYGGAGIYLFGSSYMPARVNIYGGIIEDNYSHDTAYNFQNTSSMLTGGGGIATDNVGNGASILSLSGSPKIINNKAYDFASNQYISTNLNYSTESVNSIKILDKLYTEQAGVKTYASIGLWGGAGEQLTSNYTLNGNTHEDVNKIFFSDNPAQAVAYNTSNGELRYVVSNLNTLTYHSNNGLLQTSSISVVDKISISMNMFSKIGHVFSHWNTAADDTGTRYEPDDILTLSNNQALYAIWTPATYTLSYQTNGGKFNAGVPQSYTYSTTQALPIPVWTGKTFEGWYDNALLTGSPLTQIEETTVGNLTLYAKWSGVSQHTITSTAGLNGSIYPSGSIIYNGTSQDYWVIPANGYKISTFTVDGVDKLTAISNNKYVVSGVTSDVNIEVTFEKIATTDITVFASSGQQGSITPNGFSVVGIGQSITYYMTPNPGYRISDVKVNGVSVGAVSSYTLSNITSTQSIIVEFSPLNTIIQSPVSFNLNGGQFMGIYVLPSTYTEGLGLQLPSASELSKANHTFAGWFDNESLNGTPSTYIAVSDTGEQTYWAKWVKDSTTITFESNGGDAVAAIQQVEGTNIDAPNPPTKIGYTFAGWYSDSGLTTAYVFNTMPASDVTLYAKWIVNAYNIQFESNGGSAVTTITQNFDTVVTKPVDPTKLGHTFDGWYSDSDLTTAYVFNTMPASDVTLYAKWSINAYNIQFESNGGSAVTTITQNFDTVVTKPVDPTKLGHTFDGWYSDSDLTTAYVFNTMPAADITLYAKWTINAYNIQFESNGGSSLTTITQNFDTVVTKPVDPTKLGHTFGGWYSDSDLTTAYVFNTMPAADITLYAKWSINAYNIQFESNGGSSLTTITQNFDTVVTKPVDPTKLGHTFGGWYSDSGLTTAYVFNTMPASDVTLYAKWTINSYNIQFESNGGSEVSTITQNFDTVVTKPVDPTKLGHTFDGWYSDSDLTTAYVFNTMPAADITLYAKWTINAYNIQFESNGGSSLTTITQNFDTVVTKPVDPTKLGHTFGGWYSDSDLTTAYVFNTMPAADITLYAKWSINAYNIQFESNGGSSLTTITQNFDTVVTKPVDPTKLGHTFGGWYSDSDLTTAYVFNTMPASDVTLYAKWTINSYNIQFESNGGSEVSTITQNFDTVVTKPVDPTKLGYTFGGWYLDSDLTTAYVFNTMPAADITLYAKWSINAYNIQFESNGGSSLTTITQNFDTVVTKPVDPTKLGYTFGGWYLDSGLTTAYVFDKMSAESMTLYAKWSINAYNIQFESNGGSSLTTITQNFDTVVTKPVDPTKLGHTFGGWYSDSGLTTAYVFNTMPASDVTLYAKWTINSYNIQFESNGGSEVSTITQNFDTVVTKPVDPTKLGHTFDGWYSDSDLTTAYVFNTMPAADITLYAKWTINAYNIQFESNGGSSLTTITQNFDTVVTKPVDPTKLGHTFGGWYSDSDLTTAYVFNTMPAADITLYAKWSINAYNIQFESNGGSSLTTITQNFDTVVTKPVDPTKLGHTFGGWYSDSDLTTAYVFNTMPASDVTLYAKWTINSYNIQFESNGGSEVSTITQNFDTVVTKPVDPTKLGYTFGGWYLDSDLTTAYVFNTMPAADITLYAKWSINAYNIQFESNGGSSLTTITQNFDTVVTKPVDPTKLGYTFGGWYLDSGLTTAYVFDKMSAESMTLYAKWTINSYNIQFESNGGSEVSTITQNFDTVVTKPVDPTKLGHTFDGWYSDSDLTTAYVFNTMPAADITLYAKWTINAYNIQFESNGGSSLTTITQNFDTVVTKPVDPTKLGHTFDGWYSDSDLTTAYVFNTMPAADITLYAKWTINAYNIQFESNGGSSLTTITQNFDTVVTKPVDPTKLGHTFGGWYSDSDLTTAYVFNTMPAADITLYAKWSINAYNIQFESNGGSSLTTITQNFDTVVTKPVDPTKLGHTFGGWYSDSDLTTAYVFNTMPASDVTLYAKWTINSYNIQFESNGGSEVSTITQNFDTVVTKPVDPTKLGYTFGGWYLDSDLTTAYVFNTMPAADITLYAKWSINAYNIQFESNGGSSLTTITQNFDTVVTKPVDPTKLGYTFGGWYLDSGLTTAYVFDKMSAESMTLYAKWSINAYNIQFESNGGSSLTTITQNFDTVVTKPVDPTKLGHTFGGWYSDSGLTTAYVFNTMPASDVTLYAKWTINSYNIQFESNGGSEVSTITQNFDTVVTKPVDPTKLGHTFDGWYSDSDLTTAYVFNTMPAADITLYAKWTINAYNIQFESNGGSSLTTITQNFDTVVTKPVDPTKLGHTFGGWYSDSDLTTAYVFNTMPAADITLYAKWSINAYNIQFESNGGSSLTTITQNFDTVVTKPVDPTKLGHTFGGWYSDSDLTTAYVFNTMPASDVTLYAKWIVNAYNIQFESNGGSAVTTITQNFDTVVTKPVDPTKLGYTFGGWYSDSDLTTAYVFNTMPAADITLYAKWSINAYNIQFESNGGSSLTTITQNFDTVVTKPVDPTKLGHTFGGWYSDSDLTTAYVFNTMPASDVTLYAKWIVNAYNIQFESNGGSAVTTITQNFDTVVTKPVDPTKLGYTFGGWYLDSGLTTAYVFDKMSAESMTLYAKWSINAYNIQFESNGGSSLTTITQNFDTVVTKPVDPTKLGYTFGGWYLDSDLTTAYVFNTMPASDITLYAKWSINAYNIQFESNGGSSLTTITQNFDTVVTKPVDPTKLGHTFGGWYSDSDLTTAYVFNTMPASDVTLYAKWIVNAYNIQFESNGGSAVTTITQNFDTVVTKPVDPTKLGYTFGGWYSDSGLTTAYVFDKMSAESMTLYAKWTINSYSIHFESNGGSVVSTITQNFDTVVTKPVDPTKLGHTFGGWYLDSDLTTAYVFNTIPASDVTLYAKWTINTYTITFDTKGGSVIQTVSLEFGEAIDEPNIPTKSGFIFNGWNQLLPAVMPAEDIVLVAFWLKVSDTSSEHGSSNSLDLINAIDPALVVQKDVEVSIVFERKLPTNISNTIKSSIESLLNQNQKYAIMDIRVILKAQGQSDIEINELNEKISITLVLSKNEQGHKNYQIIAVHNGQAKVIDSVYNAEDKTITFETDQFSTFAIVYQTSSQQWGWWFLILLIPIGFVTYKYRKNWLSLISKKQN